MIFNQKIWKFQRKCLLWPNKSNTQTKVGGTLKVCPLAAKPPNIKNLKRQVFELTTSFWLHRFSQLPEKKLKKIFYLCLHIGHGCFGPKFHISSIFRFVSIALGSGKIKIFQNFGFFWKWHTLTGKEWSKVLETQYFWVMVPQKFFGHFWRHWPAHFFTTRWMRSSHYDCVKLYSNL